MPPEIDQISSSVFQDQGFYQAPELIPSDLIDESVEHMDRVINGNYETNPNSMYHFSRNYEPGNPKDKLIKINNAHGVDSTLLKLISYHLIGETASLILFGAKQIQVWHTQLLYKPTGGTIRGNIGFHQDYFYWQMFKNPEGILTAWIALSDITIESGPMCFVPGSHLWGLLDPGNFNEQIEYKAKAGIKLTQDQIWIEYPVIMPRGSVSFHHPMTFHGSGPNKSDQPRRSIAVHLCTEKSCLILDNEFVTKKTLKSLEENPVIYRGKDG